MDTLVMDVPNLPPEKVQVQEASTGLDAIAQKMAAMRNQVQTTKPTGTGVDALANESAPVAPQGVEVSDDNTEPEIADPDAEYSDDGHDEADAPEQVSTDNSTAEELIDFLEFADTNPNAKFKFMRNGKEVVIDAKKAASILGQGAAISEDARQLKIEKSEFDEYLNNKRAEAEGLILAMEFTIQPEIQRAYDEIVKVQQYQSIFHQQLAQTRDPAQQARLRASIEQNEQYIAQQGDRIKQLKPRMDEFYNMRSQQVRQILDQGRKGFKDKELRNEYVYNEVREKVAKGWAGARGQLVPGVDNIDLVSADEHIVSLLRDGLKYRDRPKVRQAGGSIAALTTKRSGTQIVDNSRDELSSLRERAKGRGKEATQAADNLLVAQLRNIRAARTSR